MTFIVEDRFIVRLGGNTFINVPDLIVFNGESLFTLKRHDENGYLGIYFDIYDAAGKRIAAVKRNEIYYGDKSAYKIEGSLNRYVFSERESGKVICDIKKREDAHPAELDVSVHLYTPSGFLFDATPEQTNLPGRNIFRGNTFQDCRVGMELNVGQPPAGGAQPQPSGTQPAMNRSERRAQESRKRRRK